MGKENLKEVPEVNKTYNCFDDGKISNSRLYTVDVKEVIPFHEADSQMLADWKMAVRECYWLYSEKTDFFIKAENGEDGNAIFARTKNGGWFSMGNFMNSGRLDVDGKLTEILTQRN